MPAGGILAKGDAAEAAGLARRARIVEVDGVFLALLERLGKIDEDGIQLALVLEIGGAEQDLLDRQVVVEIDLNPRIVLQHPEADGILAAQELLVRIDPHVEVVGQQIVVGAIAAVLTAQDIGARWVSWLRSRRRLPGRRWCCRRRRLRTRAIVGAAVLAEQVLVEPADDVLEALDAVPGFSRA